MCNIDAKINIIPVKLRMNIKLDREFNFMRLYSESMSIIEVNAIMKNEIRRKTFNHKFM